MECFGSQEGKHNVGGGGGGKIFKKNPYFPAAAAPCWHLLDDSFLLFSLYQ